MRRVFVEKVEAGRIALAQRQAHHVRDVLRLRVGDDLEVFDSGGLVGRGIVLQADSKSVLVQVNAIEQPTGQGFESVIASAIPKGSRGDWLVEKLSELGIAEFVVGSSRVDLQACKLEYSIVSPK